MTKTIDTGWSQRLAILKRDADYKFLQPLRLHNWQAVIEEEMSIGEYLIISAERGGYRHLIGLMYSSATDNKYYKILASRVEHIFINSPLYKLQSFAYGINKPVSQANDFQNLLFEWNKFSSDGKFAPVAAGDEVSPKKSQLFENLSLISDNPIEALWLHIRQIQSLALAKKLITERAQRQEYKMTTEGINSRAEGIAFALRNASDYFQAGKTHNLSQRIVNVYYGSLAFAFAEMLASPNGPSTLTEIEKFTKQGHGLYTIDGESEKIEHLIIGVISSGFFSAWLKSTNLSTSDIPSKKPRDYSGLSSISSSAWLTLEQVFASIPELSNLFSEIFDTKPKYAMLAFDAKANFSPHKTTRNKTYALFTDKSGRLEREDIALFPGPISDISLVTEYPGIHFRAIVDHTDKKTWWEALNIHKCQWRSKSAHKWRSCKYLIHCF